MVDVPRFFRGGFQVANHPQAEKRNRQREKRQAHHRHYRSTMRTLIKRVKAAIESKDPEKAAQELQKAIPAIDQGAGKNVLPRKRASRTISRLARAVNALKS
jgi:small subunit ribosomal protein S20